MKRGFIIITHGNFGKELLNSVEMIVGNVKNAIAISLEREDRAEDLGLKIEKASETLGGPKEIVLFTDLMGGTPCNQGTIFGRKNMCYTVTGVNMPMIVEFVMADENDNISDIVTRCMNSAREGIKITSDTE